MNVRQLSKTCANDKKDGPQFELTLICLQKRKLEV